LNNFRNSGSSFNRSSESYIERLRKDFNSKLVSYYKDSSNSNFYSDQEDINNNNNNSKINENNFNILNESDMKSNLTNNNNNNENNNRDDGEALNELQSQQQHDDEIKELNKMANHINNNNNIISNSEFIPNNNLDYKSSKNALLNTVIVEETEDYEYNSENERLINAKNEESPMSSNIKILNRLSHNSNNSNNISNGSSANLSDSFLMAKSREKDDLVEKFCTKHIDKIKSYVNNLLKTIPMPDMPENENDFNNYSILNNTNSFSSANNNIFNGLTFCFTNLS
jgi:hypothetical protein